MIKGVSVSVSVCWLECDGVSVNECVWECMND